MDFKRVLITGGTGFLGKAVTERFRSVGVDVASIGSRFYDLRDKDETCAVVRGARPNCVVNLAADCGGIGYNRNYPGQLFYNNMMMNLNVVDACRVFNIPKLVLLGSVCGYPKFTPVPFQEKLLWHGYPEETNSAYGLAKRETLTLAQSYRKQYGLNSIYLLMVNLYGPHDHFFSDKKSHVIPALIDKFVDAKEEGARSVTLWGSGKPTREFLYVEDAAEAIFLATERYNEPEPVNIGTGNEVSIAELAEAIRSIVGYYGEVLWDATYPDGQPRRCLDVSKAKDLFGFKSKITYSEGLRRTVEWYLKEKERRNGN